MTAYNVLKFYAYGEAKHTRAPFAKYDTPGQLGNIAIGQLNDPTSAADEIIAHYRRNLNNDHFRFVDVAGWARESARERFGIDRANVYTVRMKDRRTRRTVSVVFWIERGTDAPLPGVSDAPCGSCEGVPAITGHEPACPEIVAPEGGQPAGDAINQPDAFVETVLRPTYPAIHDEHAQEIAADLRAVMDVEQLNVRGAWRLVVARIGGIHNLPTYLNALHDRHFARVNTERLAADLAARVKPEALATVRVNKTRLDELCAKLAEMDARERTIYDVDDTDGRTYAEVILDCASAVALSAH